VNDAIAGGATSLGDEWRRTEEVGVCVEGDRVLGKKTDRLPCVSPFVECGDVTLIPVRTVSKVLRKKAGEKGAEWR